MVLIHLEFKMTLAEEAAKQMRALPPEKQRQALDFITFLREQTLKDEPESEKAERGEQIKAALQRMVELEVFAHISDPVEWQRKIRADRSLPGRDA
jgi:hypothetical protein